MSPKSAFILGAALLLSSLTATLLLTNTWESVSAASQNIQVTGSARRVLTSDFGVLRASIQAENPRQLDAYRQLQEARPLLETFLEEQGISKDSVRFFPSTGFPIYNYNHNGEQLGLRAYQYHLRFEISSADVKAIEKLAASLSSLIERGVSSQIESVEYYYTGLAELKIEIQAEAAKDAQERASRIAEATGRKLGPLTAARMGVLQITPRYSNVISDYGMNDASSIEKEITAVVSSTFALE